MRETRGFAFIAVISMLVVLAVLITAYFVLTNIEVSSTRSIADGTTGYYAAEAGLNLRAEQVRGNFVQYKVPEGTSPSTPNACQSGNLGTGDFACISYNIRGRTVNTYIVPDGPPAWQQITIPPGSAFQNLKGQRFTYNLVSEARRNGRLEASLGMKIRLTAIPMFQFMAFYQGDLELGPGPAMTINGPMHTNGSLYLSAITGLQINDQVTYVNQIYHGRKKPGDTETDTCKDNKVSINNAANTAVLIQPGSVNQCSPEAVSNVSSFGGRVQKLDTPLQIPPASSIAVSPDSAYWTNADLRIGLTLSGTPQIQVLQKDLAGGVPVADSTATSTLNGCTFADPMASPPIPTSSSPAVTSTPATVTTVPRFYNVREGAYINMLNIDVRRLLQCIYANPGAFGGLTLDNSSNGGLVIFVTVLGPSSNGQNNYGVRLRNANVLSAITTSTPAVRGLTFVSDQAVYVQGNYNCIYGSGASCTNTLPGGATSQWKPAAILADSLNILSTAWPYPDFAAPTDPNSADLRGPMVNEQYKGPVAGNTLINAAFLAGVDQTASGAGYNGGLQNYPRFHENWDYLSGATLRYRGSFVSLGIPQHVDGLFNNQRYLPPTRVWGYETAFNDPNLLPPMTPWAVFLQQEQFVRQFEQ